jgi:hypothetical protein
MPSLSKIFDIILRGQSDTNVRFADLQRVVRALGFEFRVKGDHFIYWRADVEEILNFQPLRGGKAKPYQVKQLRNLVLKYSLKIKEI